ncbi:MAG: hypothetical protein JSS74_05510 [Actinobacteria bacterium]|nr:hypothetical protein [Actinomycetota bacterium]
MPSSVVAILLVLVVVALGVAVAVRVGQKYAHGSDRGDNPARSARGSVADAPVIPPLDDGWLRTAAAEAVAAAPSAADPATEDGAADPAPADPATEDGATVDGTAMDHAEADGAVVDDAAVDDASADPDAADSTKADDEDAHIEERASGEGAPAADARATDADADADQDPASEPIADAGAAFAGRAFDATLDVTAPADAPTVSSTIRGVDGDGAATGPFEGTCRLVADPDDETAVFVYFGAVRGGILPAGRAKSYAPLLAQLPGPLVVGYRDGGTADPRLELPTVPALRAFVRDRT